MSEIFRPGTPPDPAEFQDWQGYAKAINEYLKQTLADLERLSVLRDRVLPKRYTVTNGTEDRTYDADASSTAELADVIYTILLDLSERGLVRLQKGV